MFVFFSNKAEEERKQITEPSQHLSLPPEYLIENKTNECAFFRGTQFWITEYCKKKKKTQQNNPKKPPPHLLAL